MTIQDDVREQELIDLFELERPADQTRGGTDAILILDGKQLEFEIKSTTRGSVTTVRDFSLDHVQKWEGKHWLIGVYSDAQELQHTLYGSPEAMAPWIQEKAEYIRPDIELADLLPEVITAEIRDRICGNREAYSLDDAVRIQKKQYRKAEYEARMDRPKGYSPERMLEIVQDRVKYLALRGSTLNNPHIPAGYFDHWERITDNHATRLRELARAAGYPRADAIERATQ